MRTFILGLDIGGTNIRIGAVDQKGGVLCFEKVPRTSVLDGSSPVKRLCEFIAQFMEKYEIVEKIGAISVGFPGTVNKECTTVVQAPNIPGLDGVNFVQPLENAFHVPAFLCKDVWTAFYYDIQKYAVPWDGVVAGIYVGTGIGNVIAVDGKLLTGKNGAAGELGHIPVDGNTELCGCGNRGCMENLAAGKYLAMLCESGEFKGTPVGELFTRHGSHPLIMTFIERVANAVATEINILDPDAVLLGGGVLAMRDFPTEFLTAKIREHTRKPYPLQNLNLIYTQDDGQKGAVGAALYAWKRMGA